MERQIQKFLSQPDHVLHNGQVGILCNQTSFAFTQNKYLFQLLSERGVLKRVFIPEHGLFAELQDQIPLDTGDIYKDMATNIEYISLYGKQESSLVVDPSLLSDLDALVVDIQDIGSRYYTFATTLSYIFDILAKNTIPLTVYIIDRPNPAGRLVEGTLLPTNYQSFVGREGLPHRHGLTIGELAQFYKQQTGGNFELEIIMLDDLWVSPAIQPSPNIPNPLTPLIYSGQCLLEGTILSEGRGTTRPFEIFGAPFLEWIQLNRINNQLYRQNMTYPFLRPLRFIPKFHKFENQVCYGFQLHLSDESYHALAFSATVIRLIKKELKDRDIWLRGEYEFRSDRPAIELLAGDPLLLSYLEGEAELTDLKTAFNSAEAQWIDTAQPFLLYPAEPLHRLKF